MRATNRDGIPLPIELRIRSSSAPLSPYNRMQMQLGIESHIPDGLLAANALLAENSRQGVPTSTQALYQGFQFAISSTYMSLQFRCYESVSGTVVAPNKPAPPTPQPPKDACGNPLVFQNGGYEPTSCPFNPNEPPATPKQRVCQFVAGVSVPLAFVGVPEVASYLEIGPAAARFLAWTGVGGTLIGLPCS